RDMTYLGLPPFYPPGWFWLGGRAAALTGIPAWEMFKPWSILSITIAAVLALVLWAALVRFEYALIVTTATTAVMLAYSSTEPYAAIITVLLPPVFVLAWSGLRGRTRNGGPPQAGGAPRGAVVGVGIFLGIAALFYTLLLAYAAFTLVIMAAVAAVTDRDWGPVRRLAVIAAVSIPIALIGWGPWLLAALHYRPADGAELTFPMLDFTLVGALCMIGTIWLVARARNSARAAALGIAVLAVYAWSLLSMLTTLAGTTLLSFRLQPTLTVLFTAGGEYGFIEGARALADSFSSRRLLPVPATISRSGALTLSQDVPDVLRTAAGAFGFIEGARALADSFSSRRLLAVAATIGSIGALTFSQDIPDVLRYDIVVAYTDTDGNGERADRRPAGAERYYSEIDARILEVTGRPRDETVVLTADYSFLSYYPYYGFQGLTSHYANPLAQFEQRAAAIESWAVLEDADQFIAALDALPWEPPTVFLLRGAGSGGADDTYTLRLAEDVYPNQPNVRRYHVRLD